MIRSKVSVRTYGMSEGEGNPLLFIEVGRGTRADEAFFLLCEASPAGRSIFQQVVAQFGRGERIRTPEQYLELVNDIVSSRGEPGGVVSVSFAAAFVRKENFCWAAGGTFSTASISPDGRVEQLEPRCGTGHLEPGGRLIAGERHALCGLEEGLDRLRRLLEGGGVGPAIVLEVECGSRPEKGTSREKVSQQRAASVSRGHEGGTGVSRNMLGHLIGWISRFVLSRIRLARHTASLPRFALPKLMLPGSSRLGLGAAGSGVFASVSRRLKTLKLSPLGWVSLFGTVAVIVVLLFTVWPSSRKTISPASEKSASGGQVVAVEPGETEEGVSKPGGEFGLSVKWKKKYGGAVTSSPLIYEGRVYFGCRNGGLYCLDAATGEQVWRFPAGTGIGASPAVSDGKIFIGGYDGSFWCLDAGSGQRMWEFKAGAKIVSSASVASGSVLFGSYDRNLYCVSARDGKLRWRYEAAGVIWCSPCAEKGRVFFGSVDGSFYCLSLDSGRLLWRYTATGGIYSSPAVSGGIVCFGSNGRAFHFLDASSGKELFRIEANRDVRASPLMVGEIAYGASDDGEVRCISIKERTVRWTFRARRAVRSTPFAYDDMVYVTAYDGRLYALDASSGKKTASFDAGAEIYSSPTVSGNLLYFGTNNGDFCCLQIESR